jgi:hypothetical protein
VREGHYVLDDREDWSEHQPSTQDENKFIVEHGWGEYSLWHLGIDDEEDVDTKARYRFPYGDFKKVHRCGVIAAEVRAAQIRRHQVGGDRVPGDARRAGVVHAGHRR